LFQPIRPTPPPTPYLVHPNRRRREGQLRSGLDIDVESPPIRVPHAILLGRRPENADALAAAQGRNLGVERANVIAGCILVAGCLLAVLFVLLTG